MKLHQALLAGSLLFSANAQAQEQQKEPGQVVEGATILNRDGTHLPLHETPTITRDSSDRGVQFEEFDLGKAQGLCIKTKNAAYQALQMEPVPVYIDRRCVGGFIPFENIQTPVMVTLDNTWDLGVYPKQSPGAPGAYLLRPHTPSAGGGEKLTPVERPEVKAPKESERRVGLLPHVSYERSFEINGVREPSGQLVPGFTAETRCILSSGESNRCLGAELSIDVVDRPLVEYAPEILDQKEENITGVRLQPAVVGSQELYFADNLLQANFDIAAGMSITRFTVSPAAYRRSDNGAPLDLPNMYDVQPFVALSGDLSMEILPVTRCGIGMSLQLQTGAINFPSEDSYALARVTAGLQCGLEIPVPTKK